MKSGIVVYLQCSDMMCVWIVNCDGKKVVGSTWERSKVCFCREMSRSWMNQTPSLANGTTSLFVLSPSSPISIRRQWQLGQQPVAVSLSSAVVTGSDDVTIPPVCCVANSHPPTSNLPTALGPAQFQSFPVLCSAGGRGESSPPAHKIFPLTVAEPRMTL